MNKIKTWVTMSLLLLAPTLLHAAPVDLTGWIAQGGSNNWVVQAGNDTVLQTVNGAPTVFFDPTATSAQGTALSGNITVTTTSDDDFIGFVLGYDSGEITGVTTDFLLIDWKQGLQNGGGCFGLGTPGIAISHVTNASDNCGFWGHNGATGSSVVDEIERGANLGATGWNDNQSYAFNIVYNATSVQVSVDNILELDIVPADIGLSAFSDGAFGFYNYSQSNVLYSAITQVDCNVTPNAPECTGGGGTVPEPSIIALFAAGLFGIGFARRRMHG